MEQHSACDLVAREETRWMSEYSFGMTPTADTCEEVQVNCVYDEVFVGQQPLPRWFEVEGGTPLFDVSVEPVNHDDLLARDFTNLEVLPVAPEEGAGEEQVVPKSVELSLDYYQQDSDRKRLIAAGMNFGDLELLTPEEHDGVLAVGYNLTFALTALSHMELTVAFAFGAHFYLVLYLIVGVLSIAIMLVVAVYHRAVARRPKSGQPVAAVKFFSYLALTIPPAAVGVGLALLPVVLADAFIAAVVCGRVFTLDTAVFECTAPEGASACAVTPFDVISDDPGGVAVDYARLRTGRAGTALMAVGLYLMRAGMVILVPDKSDQASVAEAHDGNTWEYFAWKRSNMIFVSTFLVFLLLAIIQFSFSDMFGDNIWTAIAALKGLAIVVDMVLDASMDASLLAAPLSMAVIVVLGLVSFGADDFLDFLNAFFIELGIMVFERTYLGEAVDMATGYVTEAVPQAWESLQAWFSSDDDGEEDAPAAAAGPEQAAGAEADAAEKPPAGGGSDDTSDAEVFYSEEDSADAFADDDVNDDDPDVILNAQRGDESGDSKDGSDSQELDGPLARMEDAEVDRADLERRRKERNADAVSSSEGDGSGEEEAGASELESASEEASSAAGGGEEKRKDSEDDDDDDEEDAAAGRDADLDEDAEAEPVEPLISQYAGYANDTLALLYTPLFVLLLWVFYTETVVAASYGIKVQDFVFYFLFSIAIAPAQIVIDIIFLNIVEWYHHLPIHDYLDYMAHRFKTRKARWKGDEPFVNQHVTPGLRSLDQLCFSAQHYFVQALYVAGMSQVVLGIQVLLWADGYNVFADLGTMPVVLSMYALCALLERACRASGRHLKVWEIDASVERLEGQNESVDIRGLFAQLRAPAGSGQALRAATPARVKFHATQWRVVEQARTQEDALKNELASDRVAAQTFRDRFLAYNAPWLQGQLHEVFTPRTLFLYRKDIIEQFQAVMGPLAPDVSLSDGKPDDEMEDERGLGGSRPGSAFDAGTGFSGSRPGSRSRRGPAAAGVAAKLSEDEVNELRKRLRVQSTAAIARYWLTRMRFIATLRVQTQAIVDLNLEDECLYCGATSGLFVELMQDIEALFQDFLMDTGEYANLPDYKFQSWTRYFKEHAEYRTLCMECTEMIQDYHRKLKRRARRQGFGLG